MTSTADHDRGGPWLDSLATRLRAHYGTLDDASVLEVPGDDGAVEQLLARRLAALLAASAPGARYRFVEELERGGMGRIDLAHDAALDRTVAVKQLAAAARAGVGEGAARRALRLLTEAEIVGHLQHPGVVPIHDVGVDEDGAPFFAMPRIDGDSFAELLARRRPAAPTLQRRVEVLRRVCETMAYAHARGVVHRDLKPANVMVGRFGEVFVVDWGIARRFGPDGDVLVDAGGEVAASADPAPGLVDVGERDGLTRTGIVFGTPAYMPPERAVLDGDRSAGDAIGRGVAGDVYGVGAMLYEVLVGGPPYLAERPDEATVTAILAAIRARSPRPVAELAPRADDELAAICARAMHRDPARRYPGMHELAADLQAWSEHRVVVGARAATPFAHVRKWLRRNRPLAATIAASTVVLGAAAMWFVLNLAVARDAAEANLNDLLDLAVVQRVADLRATAETELWPAASSRVPAMREWLQAADELRPAHARLRERAAALAALDAVNTESVDARWQRRLLDDALATLETFFAADPVDRLGSDVAAVAARIGLAERLVSASRDDEAARTAWRDAAAHARTHARYAAVPIELEPVDGLLPLGADPVTGLLEFAHLMTGEPAARDDDGGLRLGADDGVVLVLVPGGTFRMGATHDGDHNVDPLAETINESPVHPVTLAPFLIAKFELTQAQWQRVTGTNPSVHRANSIYVADDAAPRHPVESVDWLEARTVLHKLGLTLPTEAQWEFAARAGTDTPWHAGAVVDDLLVPPAGNLADAASSTALGLSAWSPTPGLDDGYVMHAPVGSFAPNAFGLYDVIGNVHEWCEDEYVSYAHAPDPHTGGRPLTAMPSVAMYRGGAFDEPAAEARSANRAGGPPTRRHFATGIRPAMRLPLRR